MSDRTQDDPAKPIPHPETKEIDMTRRHFLQGGAVVAAGAGVVPMFFSDAKVHADTQQPGCSEWTQPTDADFAAIVGKEKAAFIDRVLDVLENEVVSEDYGRGSGRQQTVRCRNSKQVGSLNSDCDHQRRDRQPRFMHGEVTAIFEFYDLPKNQRPSPKDTIFIATHEPCPLCLSSITWGGWDNFFYLFTYEDSRDAYGIPHDIVMLDEIFRDPEGTYNEKNKFWSAWGLRDLIATTKTEQQAGFDKRVKALKTTYAEMSDIYQKAKAAGKGRRCSFEVTPEPSIPSDRRLSQHKDLPSPWMAPSSSGRGTIHPREG